MYFRDSNGDERITDFSTVSKGDTVYVETEDGLKSGDVVNVQIPEDKVQSLTVRY